MTHRHLSSPPSLVIFDCDGVLIDSEIIAIRLLHHTANNWGLEMPLALILQQYVGVSWPSVLADIKQRYHRTMPRAFTEQYNADLLATFDAELQAIPFVCETIQNLKVPYCVATSSSPERIRRSLKRVGLHTVLADVVFTASEVKRGKPAPDLFLHAAQKMNAVPSQCLVIEDSKAGVAAARAAAMPVVRFTGGSHLEGDQSAAGALFAFDDFRDLGVYFPELFLHHASP